MRNLIVLPLIALFLSISLMAAHSNVVVQDTDESSIHMPTMGEIGTGSGNAGDYVIITCGINEFGGLNAFNDPSPLSWTPLDVNECTGHSCNLGIWGGFVNDPLNQQIECSWNMGTDLFVTGSIRYSDVHPTAPIIDVACNTGFGETITSPSINTEAGSQVLRVTLLGGSSDDLGTIGSRDINDFIASKNEASLDGKFIALAENDGSFTFLGITGESKFFPFGGPTGTEVSTGNINVNWRACTIGIRMKAPSVPTMSEWGLISFAAFAGIAGIWYLRRRQVTA